MNLSCIICSDLFVPTADIYSTACGHVFHYHCLLHWLDKSKTCPQCRTRATTKSLVRLFVNVCSSQDGAADATVLQHKLDGVEFQMRLKDKDISNLTEKRALLKKQNAALRAEIKRLEVQEVTHQSAMAALKDQIHFFKGKSVQTDELKVQVGQLKKQLKDLEHVQAAVSGSRRDIENIIRNENSVESLALLAATLKKSLIDSDRRKMECQFELKRTQNEFSKYKREMEEKKCEFEETKRQLSTLKSNYEREITFLKNKFSQLEKKSGDSAENNESLNASIRRVMYESPVNVNRTLAPSHSIIDLSTPPIASLPKIPKKKSPFSETVSDSPLPVVTIGPLGIQRSIGSKSDDKFSIFKNKSASQFEPVQFKPNNTELGYNGLGSSSKDDIFPTAQETQGGLKRSKSHKTSSAKLRKLSAQAGKVNKTVTDFF